MAALLSSQIGDTDSVVKYINEARELGIEVLPPDVNESGYKFTVIGDKRIRFGLGAIRNVGTTAIDSILAARAKGAVHLALRSLRPRRPPPLQQARVRGADRIRARSTRSADTARSTRGCLDTALQEASLKQQETASGQVSLFGDLRSAPTLQAGASRRRCPNVAPWSESRAAGQREGDPRLLHLGHPLEPFRTECELFATHTVSATSERGPPSRWRSACVVTAIKRQISKQSGAEFARLTVEDFSGSSEVLVFPEAWSVLDDRVKRTFRCC